MTETLTVASVFLVACCLAVLFLSIGANFLLHHSTCRVVRESVSLQRSGSNSDKSTTQDLCSQSHNNCAKSPGLQQPRIVISPSLCEQQYSPLCVHGPPECPAPIASAIPTASSEEENDTSRDLDYGDEGKLLNLLHP